MSRNHTLLRHGRRGLTLVEMMVAIAILVIMSGIVVESMRNSIEFHNLLSDRDSTVRAARVAMSKLRRDLQLAYLTPNRAMPDRFLTVFVGLDEEPDKLFFTTLNHQRLYLNSREADMTEVTVWAERSTDGPGYTLYHRESPIVDEEPDEDGVVWPLAYNVRSFHLRYMDHREAEWKEAWDTRTADTPYRLPRAVEIALVLIAPDPEDPTGERTVDVPFLTTVALEYTPPLANPNDPASVQRLNDYLANGAGGFPAGSTSGPFNPGGQQAPGSPPPGARGNRNPNGSPRGPRTPAGGGARPGGSLFPVGGRPGGR